MKRSRRKPEPLPPSCVDCRPFEGRWKRGETGGLERCGCARGREIYDRSPEGKRKLAEAARAEKQRAKQAKHDGRLAGAGNDL